MRRGWIASLIPVFLIAGAVALRVADPPNLRDFRYKIFDGMQRLAPRDYEPAAVVVIDLDERTLDRYGQWPWPRTRVARLVENLQNYGAPAIALDIVFAEPDQTSPDQLVKAWRNIKALQPTAKMLSEASIPSHDALLAGTLGQARSVVGAVLSDAGTDTFSGRQAGIVTIGDDPRPFLFAYSGAVNNLPILTKAATGVGALNVIPDHDGVVRRLPVVLRQGDRIVPSLWAEALRVAQGASSLAVKSSNASNVESLGQPSGVSSVRIGAATIQTDTNGHIWLYDSGPTQERVVSAAKVLDGSVDPSRLRGKIALIGTSAAGLKDDQTTPLSQAMPGVELHAQAIEQAIQGSYLKRPSWTEGAEVLATLGAGLLIAIAFWTGWVGAIGMSALAIVVVAGLGGLSWERFAHANQLFDPVYPALLTVAVYISATYAGFRQTEMEKRQVRQAFSYYLSPAMVERLTRSPEMLRLGGESRDLTLLFCDIRGFTSLAETMSASEISSLLNRFLTPMTDAIMSAGGTVDKYMGDAIMAFWNAPLDDPHHAQHALAAAREMRRRCHALNTQLREEAENGTAPAQIGIGIGINTGICSVGNMGSMQRFDYSALGDNVNLASRLEGMSKQYGVDLIVSDQTKMTAPDVPCIELDKVQVKGRLEPTRIFTVPDDTLCNDPDSLSELQQLHEDLLTAYRDQNWTEARQMLAQCRAHSGASFFAEYYALMEERIALLEQTPPPDDWDGTFVAETK